MFEILRRDESLSLKYSLLVQIGELWGIALKILENYTKPLRGGEGKLSKSLVLIVFI